MQNNSMPMTALPSTLPLIPNACTYPVSRPPSASPILLPTETTKQSVLDAVTAYMSKYRNDMKEAKESPEQKWVDQWLDLISCATMSAHEGFLASAALNDFYVGQQILPFLSLSNQEVQVPQTDDDGRTHVGGAISLAQYAQAYSGPPIIGTSDAGVFHPAPDGVVSPFQKQCEETFKVYDVDNDGKMNFGEFVTMQFAPQLMNVLRNQGGFPVPLAADGMPLRSDETLAKSATELLSSSLAEEVEVAFKRYVDGLRSKIDTKGVIEVVSMNSIFQRIAAVSGQFLLGPTSPDALQMQHEHDKAFSHAILAGQERFMAVLLGLDRTSTVGLASTVCDLWMATECKIFEIFDVDGSGTLDTSELSKAMEKATSGTGYHDPDLMGQVAPSAGAYGSPMIDYEEMAGHFLDAFDVDSSGTISRSEWLVARAAFQSIFLTSSFYVQAVLPTKPLQPVMDPLQHLPGATIAYPQAPVGYASSRSLPSPMPLPVEKKAKKKKKKKKTDFLPILGVVGAIGGAVCCAGVGGVALYRARPFTKGFFVGLLSGPAVAVAAAICFSKMGKKKSGKKRGTVSRAVLESTTFKNTTQTDIDLQLSDDAVFVLRAEEDTPVGYNWNKRQVPRFNGKRLPVMLKGGMKYIVSFRGGDKEKPMCELSQG